MPNVLLAGEVGFTWTADMFSGISAQIMQLMPILIPAIMVIVGISIALNFALSKLRKGAK